MAERAHFWVKAMRSARCNILFCSLLVVPLLPSGLLGERKGPPPSPIQSNIEVKWRVVANNGVMVPNDGRNFNSYNEPSLNVNQLVVFRARSKGGMGREPAHAVFIPNMAQETPVITVFDRTTSLPQPNNLGMTFREPPSFPRIDLRSDTIASRGNHGPAWRSGQAGGFSETPAGTPGIYTNPFGILIAGASNLGEMLGFSFFGVPGLDRTQFDVFPGTPAVTDGATIVLESRKAFRKRRPTVRASAAQPELNAGCPQQVWSCGKSTSQPMRRSTFTASTATTGRS